MSDEIIDEAVVRKTARLARLSLQPNELAALAKDLQGVLVHVREIEKLDLSQVPATAHALDLVCPMAEDGTAPGIATPLASAPDKEGTAFKVPKIIE